MAKLQLHSSNILRTTIYLLLLAITLGCASSARILDEVDPQSPNEPDASDPDVAPTTTLPNGQIPATGSIPPVGGAAPLPGPAIPLPTVPGPVIPPGATVAPIATPATTLPNGQIPATGSIPPVGGVAPLAGPAIPLPGVPGPIIPPGATVAPIATPAVAPIATPATTLPSGPTGVAAGAATGAASAANAEPPLAFFMHDILGGTHPSGRVVTGIIANSQDNGLPFSKGNSQVFPINGGVSLNNINGIVNNNNVPFLVGLNGSPTSTTFQNSGNNLPFVSAGQLPAGLTLQQLMFGSITVVDNELTEGHELGSSVLGKGQGFYLASSLDGTTHTLALTTLFHGGDHDHVDDTISFFGVHRTGSPVSHIAVIGGTGKYEHAKGYATIETLHQGDQHTTDGVETVTHFTVYLTYP